MKKINLFITFLFFVGFVFSQDPQFDNTISIGQTYTTDTEIFPFNGETLYGISINGDITFNSDNSMVRLVIIDQNSGLEYMVYETYPMLETEASFSFTEGCDETCFLDGFSASSMEIWIIDATLDLDALKWSDTPMANILDLQMDAKTSSDLEKIAGINTYIDEKGMIWKAGITSYSNMFYSNRKVLFGSAYNLFGLEFYMGGVFEVFGTLDDSDICEPTYGIVDNFDWRSRHNANMDGSGYYDGDPYGSGWMTDPECQSGCIDPSTGDWICSGQCDDLGIEVIYTDGCAGFAGVGVVEGNMNIYFNQHINANLSEQQMVSDPQQPDYPQCVGVGGGGNPENVLQIISDYGIVDEECFPLQGDETVPCSLICDEPTEIVTVSDHFFIPSPSVVVDIKRKLILEGPMVWYPLYPIADNHAVVLVGFDIINEGDYIEWIGTIGAGDTHIGKTYWIFKNSSSIDDGVNGYIYSFVYDYPDGLNGLIAPLSSNNYGPLDRQCLDLDLDGYFNWGIGEKPPTCQTCPDEMDGNDNDYTVGPLDEDGFSTIINTYNVSFENGFEEWGQSGEDDQEWIVHEGPTISFPDVGPQSAQDGNYYIYLNAYESPYPYKTAIIESPPINLDVNCFYEINFWYYKYVYWGGEGSKLELQTSSNNGETWGTAWGVYGNTQQNEWLEINLQITANINKIRFVGKSGLNPPNNDMAIDNISIIESEGNGPFVIETGASLVWESDYHACDNIIIKPGASLTIGADATLFMLPGKKIVVERTAQLINRGLITSDGVDFWEGIELWGENGADANLWYQGQVSGSGTFENALCAIRTIKVNENGDYDYNYSGGKIMCTNATFLNNRVAIDCRPYGPATSTNSFTGVVFEVNDDIFMQTSVKSIVMLNNIKGTMFKYVTFDDNRTGVDIKNKARGIFAIDSKFSVHGLCLDDPPNSGDCVDMGFSEFNSLSYGIYAIASNTENQIVVKNTNFLNNLHGAYISGIDNINVTLSNFQTYDQANPFVENYGMYLDNCTGYIVEENNFYNSDLQIRATGLVISNSGPATNEIYKNYFSDLQYGLIAQEKNRNPFGNIGLEIKCNEFSNCGHDISVTKKGPATNETGIRYNQGSNDDSPEAPAGNQFSYSWLNDESDYYNETNGITYWYHQNNGGYNVKPEWHSKPQVNPQENNNYLFDFDPETACPSNLGGGGTDGGPEGSRGAMASAGQNADSVQNLLNMIVDGGNTETLATEVQNAFPPEAYDLYVELMGKSPYLSDTVLKSAINKENVLPPELLTDVLIANPQVAKSDEMLTEIENRSIPLTDEMKEEIMLNWYIAGAKESLESKLSGYNSERGNALNRLIGYFRNDTLSPSPSDSIIALLEQENALWAKYALAHEYLAQGETGLAENAMGAIPVDFALSQSGQEAHVAQLAYFNVIKQLKQDGRDWDGIDEQQAATLYGLAYSDNSKANAFARNVLMFYDTLTFVEPVQYPSFMKSGSVIPIPAQKPAERNSLKVYPNPAKDYFIIRYELDNSYAEAMISITDITGRGIKEMKVSTMRDYLLIPTGEIKPGTYVVKLILNGRVSGTQKVNIQN